MTRIREEEEVIIHPIPPTKLFPWLAVNKTILTPWLVAATGAQYHIALSELYANTYTWDFPDIIKFCIAAHMLSVKALRFQHLDYNAERAQKLISSSMSRHLSTRNI